MNTGSPAGTRAVMTSEARGREKDMGFASSLQPREEVPAGSGRHSRCAKSTVSKVSSVPRSSRLSRSLPVRRGT
ncbi:MAG: hypothetical protein R3A52_28160 [Polyangiales bacterium]